MCVQAGEVGVFLNATVVEGVQVFGVPESRTVTLSSLGKTFSLPKDAPEGTTEYWEQAI